MSAMLSKRLSYDLDEGMLRIIREDFAPEKVASQFARALAAGKKGETDKIGKDVFGKYGEDLMRCARELGEEHTDATYEVLKETIAKTGVMYFPLVPQRFVEIAYLGVMSFLTLDVVQNNGEELIYRLKRCDIYDNVKEKTGAETAATLPCRHGCLAALDTIFRDLNIPVEIKMGATMPRDGFCQFAASKA